MKWPSPFCMVTTISQYDWWQVINDNYLVAFKNLTEEVSEVDAKSRADLLGLLKEVTFFIFITTFNKLIIVWSPHTCSIWGKLNRFQQALDINSVSFLLHTMANTYVRVSGSHVLGKLASLAKMLTAKDDAERDQWSAFRLLFMNFKPVLSLYISDRYELPSIVFEVVDLLLGLWVHF